MAEAFDSTDPQPPRDEATFTVKAGLAEMLKGGVIMDVVTPEQAKIAEDAGAAAVMALERVPADIRRDGGVARMSDPIMIRGIQEAVTIPVMAKARIGHFVEAQVLEALEVDYIDESEVLTPADEANHIDKWAFKVPFVCGATNLGEALRRIGEGAAMIRSKGEAGTGDIVEAVRHLRLIGGELRRLTAVDESELATAAKNLQAPLELVRQVAREGRLPVVLFCAGGIATPADASLVMQLGAEGVFVGSGIFKSEDPERRARAIVEATKKLGMFELTGLPPAPRGVPQIEVTFDIDANGIVNVSAKDMGTGKSQAMTITGGSALPKEDIDRMMRDAEEHAAEDRKRRDEAETRNQAESLVYQTEKFLKDNDDKLPSDIKDKVNAALGDAQQALKGTDTDAIRTAMEKLATESQAMGQALYKDNPAAGSTAGGDGGAPGSSTPGDGDEVVDAEIVDDEPGSGRK
jgi:pyridoxal 5'-phosphate synthase pdxS subunit